MDLSHAQAVRRQKLGVKLKMFVKVQVQGYGCARKPRC
jgi:hypothetical protein